MSVNENMTSMEEAIQFVVVKNHEGQYSIWDSERELPAGWEAQTGPGPKAVCLDYIREHWTDITPLSLRRSA